MTDGHGGARSCTWAGDGLLDARGGVERQERPIPPSRWRSQR